MVNHITPDELERVDMLIVLQSIAGIDTSLEMAIEGWRALSEPAKEHVIEAYNSMMFNVTYKPLGGSHVVSGSITPSSR